jgi:hypothetical protein
MRSQLASQSGHHDTSENEVVGREEPLTSSYRRAFAVSYNHSSNCTRDHSDEHVTSSH